MKRLVSYALVLGMVGVMAAADLALAASTMAAEQATATEAAATASKKKTTSFIGNSETRKFHVPSCRFVNEMKSANRVEFKSKAEAAQAGYEPCKVCLPSKETKPVKATPVPVTSAPSNTPKPKSSY